MVVVRVDAKLLIVLVGVFLVERANALHLFRENRAVAVNDVNAVGGRLANHVQGNLYVAFLRGADGHDVAGNFVALLFGVLDDFQCSWNLVNVASHANQVYGAFALGANVFLKVAAAHVGHDGKLDLFVGVFANHFKDVVVVAEFPLAEFGFVKNFLRGFISNFHIVNAGRDVGLVKFLDKFVSEHKIVDNSAVAEGCVNNANRFAHAHQCR